MMKLGAPPSVFRLVWLQLRGSKVFLASTVVLIIAYLLNVCGLGVAGQVFLAVATGVHEALHLRKASELGIAVMGMEVGRLGGINYSLNAACPEKGLVAEAPYKAPHQYIVTALWVATLAIPIPMLPPPTTILFTLYTIPPLTLLVSMLCTLITLRNPYRKLCRELASILGSRDDIREALACRQTSQHSLD